MRRRDFPVAFVPLAAPTVRGAPGPQTWVVGSSEGPPSLAEALKLAKDGDTVILGPGIHRRGGVIAQSRLTLRGSGPGVILDGSQGDVTEGKALLVVRGGDVRLENIVFQGVRVSDGNGAGVRFERGRLSVMACRFVDNQMGLLTGNQPEAELLVQDCGFEQAPAHTGRGLHHLLYVGGIAKAQVRGCRFSFGATGGQGHLLKCRAREAEVTGCDLAWNDPQGSASYELDFPNGGVVTVRGNRLAQGPASPNRTMVAFGAEARPTAGREHRLVLEDNLFRSEGSPALWWRVWSDRLGGVASVEARGNRRQGSGRAEPELPGAFA